MIFQGGVKIMRFSTQTVLVTAGVIGLIGSALAADMTGTEIKTFLSGKTAYLETTAASAGGQVGNVVIYWAGDGTALYKLPTGGIMGDEGQYALCRMEGEAGHGVRSL
jgi:hypothetical protein